RRRLDAADRSHRTGPPSGPVHDTGVQFHYAFLVWKPTVSDRGICGIFFVYIDAGNNGIERILPGAQKVHGAATSAKAVLARNDKVLRRRKRRNRGRSR